MARSETLLRSTAATLTAPKPARLIADDEFIRVGDIGNALQACWYCDSFVHIHCRQSDNEILWQ